MLKRLVEQALAPIDRVRFGAIAQQFAAHPFAKYLQLEQWMTINVERAIRVGLHRGRSRHVLDLGCGCGYFLHVCRLFGHNVQGVDLADPFYQAVTSLLQVPVIEHRIEPGTPLPVPPPYDVVTAHMICFNGHRTRSLWGARDWERFLDPLVGATVQLQLNRELDGTMYPRGVAELFGERGGVITAEHVVFERVRPAPRPRS